LLRTTCASKAYGAIKISVGSLRIRIPAYRHVGTGLRPKANGFTLDNPLGQAPDFILALLAVSISQAMSGRRPTTRRRWRDPWRDRRLPGCNLQGADLTNTCVKGKNPRGANFDGANAV